MMVARRRIGNRDIAVLQPGQVIWDGEVSGFGARRQKSATVTYVMIYRTHEGRQRWYTIGPHGAWTPISARKEAKRLQQDMGRTPDPAADKMAKRKAKAVSELCDLYMVDVKAGRVLTRNKQSKKQSTILTDAGRIERHIKPLLGRMPVSAITASDVETFMQHVAEGKTATPKPIKTKNLRGRANVRGGQGTASRTVGLLGAIFTYAVKHKLRQDNPVRGVARYGGNKRTRRLADEEYAAASLALRKAENLHVWPPAIDLVQFLLLTGWRRGEGVGLRWSEIDLARRTATLGDTKTGESIRPLSRAACDILKRQPNRNKPNAPVFLATRGEGPMLGFAKLWKKIAALGHVPSDITPHVFRHSFASQASDLGFSEPTIAALIGHKGRSMTSRYIHAADAVLLAAADAVAKRILELMGERHDGVVFELKAGARSA
jgi:integrase